MKHIDADLLVSIDNWREIIGFRNVIAHGYDVIENELIWYSITKDIPLLFRQLTRLLSNKKSS
ncbi:MAG: DUF86 domain-containing protein [Candidatus Electrothrix sp. EH2]|nr:DUF86 domain-containing protein [Candidatus Electrothrix sp. EH2]